MSSGTILTGTYTNAVVLDTPATQNPATIAASGRIDTRDPYALYGAAGFAWTISNLGTVTAPGVESYGIVLAAGGVITNGSPGASAALVEGGFGGIWIQGQAGTVSNFGTVLGETSYYDNFGIRLDAGGSVTNNRSGVIRAYNTPYPQQYFGFEVFPSNAVEIRGASGTVTNHGAIVGAFGYGVGLEHGGLVINGISGTTVGSISGGGSGIYLNARYAATVINYGSIAGDCGIYAKGGAAATIANSGTTEGFQGIGVCLAGGGTLTNGALDRTTALIGAAPQISGDFYHGYRTGTASGVVISGTVAAVVNFATITAQNSGEYAAYGIRLTAGGTVTNGAIGDTAALVEPKTGTGNAIGIDTGGGVGTITNYGTITGSGSGVVYGLRLADGGVITNGHLGDTTASIGAIDLTGTGNTIINYGSLGQVIGDVDRLLVEPGAVFTGVVHGASGSVLEFTSGSNPGDLSHFSGFTTVIFDPGSEPVSAGPGQTITVSGTVLNNSLVSSGGTEIILSGGKAVATLVEAGGILRVSSGGVAVAATVSGGGSVSAGGREIITSGGLASSSVLSDGGAAVVSSGGLARAAEVFSGGALHVSSGGVATGGTVFAGGELSVFSGGTARSTLVRSGGELLVSKGGVATHATIVGSGPGVGIGGRLFVSSGGIVSASTVSSAGAVVVSSGGVAEGVTVGVDGLLHVSNGGTASGTKVLAGGTAAALTGGTMLVTSVGAGGLLDIFNGSASATQVSNGGEMVVSGGGVATLTRVFSGGVLTVLSLGKTVDTRLSGGEEVVSKGGHAISALVSNGGTQVVGSGGTASATGVHSGGGLVVSHGGFAADLAVFSGGSAEISTGGSATAPTLDGGTLVLDTLYNLAGPIDFGGHSGGVLVISSVLLPGAGNVISGFVPSDTVDLAVIDFSTSGSVSLTSGNVLVVSENAQSYKLYLNPAQNFSGDSFHVKDDGHGDTLVYETTGASAQLALAAPARGASAAHGVSHPTSAGLLGGSGAVTFSLPVSTGFG